MRSLILSLWSSLSLYSLAASPLATLNIQTTAGTFAGSKTASGLEAWLGVPFAQPPLGNLRFAAPVAIETPATGVVQANAFRHACSQPDANLGATQSEDCLVLNVRSDGINFWSDI